MESKPPMINADDYTKIEIKQIINRYIDKIKVEDKSL